MPKKVYVFQLSEDYSGSTVYDVFSTPESAIRALVEADSPGPVGTWEVEEYELDGGETKRVGSRSYRGKTWVHEDFQSVFEKVKND